jgi:hypothetical protein
MLRIFYLLRDTKGWLKEATFFLILLNDFSEVPRLIRQEKVWRSRRKHMGFCLQNLKEISHLEDQRLYKKVTNRMGGRILD